MNPKAIVGSVGDSLYRQAGRVHSHVQETKPLPVDVLENDRAYRVVFDAPGTELDDVKVRFLDGTVKILIDRQRKYHEAYEIRFPGRARTLEGEAELPEDAMVEPDAGTATLTDDGTITIDIPKRAEEPAPIESDEITVE